MSDYFTAMIEMGADCADHCDKVAKLVAALTIGVSKIPDRAKVDFDELHEELASCMKDELYAAVREILNRHCDELRRVHGCEPESPPASSTLS